MKQRAPCPASRWPGRPRPKPNDFSETKSPPYSSSRQRSAVVHAPVDSARKYDRRFAGLRDKVAWTSRGVVSPGANEKEHRFGGDRQGLDLGTPKSCPFVDNIRKCNKAWANVETAASAPYVHLVRMATQRGKKPTSLLIAGRTRSTTTCDCAISPDDTKSAAGHSTRGCFLLECASWKVSGRDARTTPARRRCHTSIACSFQASRIISAAASTR